VLATLGLTLGLTALGATLTGVLAFEGVVLGVIAGVAAYSGFRAAHRRELSRELTGQSLAVLGMAFGLTAIVLGVLAIGGQLSWLSNRVDEVSQFRDWLGTTLPRLHGR
jgi:hypothetical protein